jgi:hypothetical protein
MNLKLIGFGIVISILALAIIFGYLYFDERKAHADDNQLNTQKYAGLQDQLTQKAESIQVLAVQVGDLNLQKNKEVNRKGYWMAIAANYKEALDSIFKTGTGTALAEEDSQGKYFKVAFGGRENFVAYSGETKYYPLPSAHSTYQLSLNFDTLDIVSTLYRDTDKLWKIKSESKTSGVKLKSYYTLDSTVFAHMISGTALPIPDPATDWGIIATLAASHILPHTIDGAVGGYYGGVSAKYFIQEKSFWVDVTYGFSLRHWKLRWSPL